MSEESSETDRTLERMSEETSEMTGHWRECMRRQVR